MVDRRRLIVMATVLFSTPAVAQAPSTDVPPSDVEAPVPTAEVILDDITVDELADRWTTAWSHVPTWTHFAPEGTDAPDTPDALRARLKSLGHASYAVSEWKGFWAQEEQIAEELQTVMAQTNPDNPRLEPIADWLRLVVEHRQNLVGYFDAIQAERDAVELRIEETLEQESMHAAAEPLKPTSERTPFERRMDQRARAERRLDLQLARKEDATRRLAYLDTLRSSSEAMFHAMQTERELVADQAALARRASRAPADVLTPVWRAIRAHKSETLAKIDTAIGRHDRRLRDEAVAIRLAAAEIGFRDRRLTELRSQLAASAGPANAFRAAADTVVFWLRERGVQIVANLALLLSLVMLSLRLIKRGVAFISERTAEERDRASAKRQETLLGVAASVVRGTIYVIAVLIAMEELGVDTSPILGSAAILGLAVSFGSQNLVRDVVNGFFILMENPFAIGDRVDLNGKSGHVERITLKSTWLREVITGDLHVVPNGAIDVVTNHTRGWSLANCIVGVAYASDLYAIEEAVNDIGREMLADKTWGPRMFNAPFFHGVTELGDSSVNIRVQARVKPRWKLEVQRELRRRCHAGFASRDIEIPFPQRVVHHLGSPPTAA